MAIKIISQNEYFKLPDYQRNRYVWDDVFSDRESAMTHAKWLNNRGKDVLVIIDTSDYKDTWRVYATR